MKNTHKKTKLFMALSVLIITLLISSCKDGEGINENLSENSSYLDTKYELILNDEKESFCYHIKLSKAEEQLEKRLIALRELFEKNIKLNKRNFYTEPFHNVKDYIKATTLFEIFKSMPKGGLLHTHSAGVTNIKWLIKEAQQLPNCYVYSKTNSKDVLYGQLGIYDKNKAPEGYVSLSSHIEKNPNFIDELHNLLILDRSTLKKSDDYWIEFEKRFMRIMPLLNYRPFFKAYYKKSFEDFIEDNIDHVEIRFIFGILYDEKTPSYPIDIMVEDLKEVVANIQKEHPNFSLNLIYTSFKFLGIDDINNQIEEAFRLKKKYPNLITGFDLVAEEDRGNTIDFYADCWKKLDALENETSYQLPLFLHAGESNSIKNKNLYDAVLLKSKRIGHGLNLVHYPSLVQEVVKNDILVEVNPLSNKILGYIPDLRNHPARILLNNDVQCSISSDDPGVFGYEGLSYDFFMAFVAWELDLKAIKKLVFNSIEYSTLDEARKKKALQILQKEWEEFILKANLILDSKNIN